MITTRIYEVPRCRSDDGVGESRPGGKSVVVGRVKSSRRNSSAAFSPSSVTLLAVCWALLFGVEVCLGEIDHVETTLVPPFQEGVPGTETYGDRSNFYYEDSQSVKFDVAFISAPGTVDLSKLAFHAVGSDRRLSDGFGDGIDGEGGDVFGGDGDGDEGDLGEGGDGGDADGVDSGEGGQVEGGDDGQGGDGDGEGGQVEGGDDGLGGDGDGEEGQVEGGDGDGDDGQLEGGDGEGDDGQLEGGDGDDGQGDDGQGDDGQDTQGDGSEGDGGDDGTFDGGDGDQTPSPTPAPGSGGEDEGGDGDGTGVDEITESPTPAMSAEDTGGDGEGGDDNGDVTTDLPAAGDETPPPTSGESASNQTLPPTSNGGDGDQTPPPTPPPTSGANAGNETTSPTPGETGGENDTGGNETTTTPTPPPSSAEGSGDNDDTGGGDTDTTTPTASPTSEWDSYDDHDNSGEGDGTPGGDETLPINEEVIDVAVFRMSGECSNPFAECDWGEVLGVGSTKTFAVENSENTTDIHHWCCTSDAVSHGMCQKSQFGRLLIDPSKFSGHLLSVPVPKTSEDVHLLRNGAVIELDKSGEYIALYAHCYLEDSKDAWGQMSSVVPNVTVSGEITWESVHGYLPANLYAQRTFYILLAAYSAGLFLWYGAMMIRFRSSRIALEKWLIATVALGLLEFFCRCADYTLWNNNGTRSPAATAVAMLFGTLRHAASRCLILMVAMGWGVARDRLDQPVMAAVLTLGAAYVVVTILYELLIIYYFDTQRHRNLSAEESEDLFDKLDKLLFCIFVTTMIFVIWIPTALCRTMHDLKCMKQEVKLQRYRDLLRIFVVSFAFFVLTWGFFLFDVSNGSKILRGETFMFLLVTGEVNYFFVLTCVAIQWRPNPSARQYAYVMELPTADDDGASDGETYQDDNGVELPPRRRRQRPAESDFHQQHYDADEAEFA